MADTQLFRKINELPRLGDWGLSNVPAWSPAASTPRTRQIKINEAVASFVLPANCRIHGDIVIYNNGAASQPAVTIGTAAAGTQVSAGAVAAAGATVITQATDTGVTRTDRTIFLGTGFLTGTHIVLNVTEYPAVATNGAKS